MYKTLGFTMGGGSRLKKLIRKYKTAHKKENNDVKYLSHTLHFSVTLVQVQIHCIMVKNMNSN